MSKQEKVLSTCTELQQQIQKVYRGGHIANTVVLLLLVMNIFAWVFKWSGAANCLVGFVCFAFVTVGFWMNIRYIADSADQAEKLVKNGVTSIARLSISEGPGTYLVTVDDRKVIQSAVPLDRVGPLAKNWEELDYPTYLSMDDEPYVNTRVHSIQMQDSVLHIFYTAYATLKQGVGVIQLREYGKSPEEMSATFKRDGEQRFNETDWNGFDSTAFDFYRRFYGEKGKLLDEDFPYADDVRFMSACYNPL